MGIEQSLYDLLNPLSDAQLQEKIQQAEGYVARGTGEDISRLCSQPLTPEYFTRTTILVKQFHISYVARKILQSRKDGKNFTLYEPLPVHTPAPIGRNAEEQNKFNQLYPKLKVNKQPIVDKLQSKNLSEAKEYIATEKRYYLTVLAYIDAIERIISLAKAGKFPFSISVIEHYLLHNYYQALISLYELTNEINTAIALTVARVKGTEANSNTPPPAPTPSPTPSAPTAPAPEPSKEEEKEDKKGISITTILIGGSLLLGFIYYLKKKN